MPRHLEPFEHVVESIERQIQDVLQGQSVPASLVLRVAERADVVPEIVVIKFDTKQILDAVVDDQRRNFGKKKP